MVCCNLKFNFVNKSYYYMANPAWANPGRALIGSFSVRILPHGPTRVFLFWSEAGKFSNYNQNSKQKIKKKKTLWKKKPCVSFFTLKLPEEAKTTEKFPKFQRWMKKTNIFKCKPPEVHFTIRNSPYCHDLEPISGTALVLG